jgi:alpha-tubulin suppressor-like RCC1 family protein
MMNELKQHWLHLPFTLSVVVVAGCDDFPLEEPFAVTITPSVAWPTSLAVTDVTTLEVIVRDANGLNVEGMAIEWRSSDSSVLQVSALTPATTTERKDLLSAQLRATVTALRTGRASVTATVVHSGFQPEQTSTTIAVDAWAVGDSAGWPQLLTVTDIETLVIDIPNADTSIATDLRVEWQSSDESVLTVSAVVPQENPTNQQTLTARRRGVVTARSSGTARVVVTVDRLGFERGVFEREVTVGLSNIDSVGTWPLTLAVGKTADLEIRVLDAGSASLPDRGIQWVSDDPSRLTVTKTGDLTAQAVAVARGPDPVSITAFIAPPGFERTELKGGIRVMESWIAVSAGRDHTCAVTWDEEAYCWGRSLGNSRPDNSPIPVEVIGLGDLKFLSVSAGDQNTCGILRLGVGVCWGYGNRGRLGSGDRSESDKFIPVTVAGPTFKSLSADATTCGIAADDRATCWGDNSESQLGFEEQPLDTLDMCRDNVRCSLLPRDVASGGGIPSTYSSISVGGVQTCGISLADGAGYCWGSAALGNASTTQSITPIAISGGHTFQSISAGKEHTCGIDTTGTAFCWGRNLRGQLGTGLTDNEMIPTAVTGGHVFVSMGAGDQHTCGLTSTGIAYCWGQGFFGQLGNNSPDQSNIPVPVVATTTFQAITVGAFHSCGLGADGAVYCWGRGEFGRIGDSKESNRFSPVRVVEPN